MGSALYRNRDDSLLLIGLICLLYALYNGMISERVLSMAGTEIPFSTLYKLKDFCSVACLGLLTFYFYRFKTGILSGMLTTVILIIFGAYLCMVASAYFRLWACCALRRRYVHVAAIVVAVSMRITVSDQ
ncbi:hypothetical protein Q0F98_21590 [Paenibacillus amylolyticus]|nr:hypothetical protein Q0F98_21590 [Paenibacillus amylolyticus]